MIDSTFFKSAPDKEAPDKLLQQQVENCLQAGMPEADPVPKKHSLIQLIKLFPIIAGLLNSISGSGQSFSTLVFMEQAKHITKALPKHTGLGLQILGFITAIIDFIRIPLMYLVAYLVGQPLPFKLSRFGAWTYATLALGLALSAFFIPGAAPVIGLVAAGIGIAVSIFTLSRVLYVKYQLNKEAKQLKIDIESNQVTLKQYQLELKDLWEKAPKPLSPDDSSGIEKKIEQIKALQIDNKALVNRQALVEKKLESKDSRKIVGKTLGVILSSAALVGLILMPFAPIAGLAILGSVAAFGGTFLLASLIIPVVMAIWKRFKGPKKEIAATQAEDTVDATLGNEVKNSAMVTAHPLPTSRGLTAGSSSLSASLHPAVKPREVGVERAGDQISTMDILSSHSCSQTSEKTVDLSATAPINMESADTDDTNDDTLLEHNRP